MLFKRTVAIVTAFLMLFASVGSVVASSLPGDVNNDGKVNMTDVVVFRRHLAGGFSQSFDEGVADVNDDQKKDETDIELMRKYAVGGYGVELIPSTTEAYTIKYYTNANDDYLKSITIENPNPGYYTKQAGIELQDLHVDGYNFLGWFTAQSGGTHITEYPVGTTGNKTLYAHWEKVTYKVQFACDMVPQDARTFTTGEEVILPTPEMDKYTFVGWSDKDGNMWESIPVGTAKNVTLYANWSSNRNKAVAKKTLGEPLIMEDSEAGLILFTYEIGEIQNVPLFTTLNLQCANGIVTTVSQTFTEEISEENAKTVAKTIASATTGSSSWTLESNWNNTTEVSQNYIDQSSHTKEEAESLAKSESGTYSLYDSSGGSSGTTKNNIRAFNLSYNNAHSNSASIERNQSIDLSVDAKYSNETTVGASIPIEIVNLEASNKSTFEIGAGVDYGQSQKKTLSGTASWSRDLDIHRETSKTTVDEKNWNTTSGYENSKTTSSNTSISNAVSKLISQEYGYGSSYSQGGANSTSQEFATTDSTSDEFSSTFTYHTAKIASTTKEFQSTGNTMGGYRMVMAGKIHVFAVVGYDVAEQTYFVYTYNVMDDATEEYLDFSRDHSFNDYETSIIPFEIPSFVNDYVNERIAKTAGLQLDPDTGIIMDYFPDEENPDTIVIIPSYMSVDNGDGTKTSVKVTGVAEGLFKNNTNIKGVKFGNFITEIPDSTFEGCTNLKYVVTPGVTKIGNNAFKGCTSLSDFTIPVDVTEVGTNAFEGTSGINAVAANASVAKAIASSGAKNTVLDISNVTDSGLELVVGKVTSFELQGKAKDYSGLSLKSDAQTTVVNGVNFVDCSGTPMDFSSANVTLNRVTATAPGYALVMSAPTITLLLNQTVTLASTSENAVICKNVTLKPLSTSVVGKLNLTGNMLVAGSVTNSKYLTFASGSVVTITDEEFENKRSSCTITFDANGGTLATNTLDVAYGNAAGTLPTPTYGDYSLVGWYTEKNGGTKFTADTPITSSMTLYAKWNNWDGTSAEPEYDASTKTYTITTGNELAWISDVSNGVITAGTNFPTEITFDGYTIELANDIYLNDTYNSNWDNAWICVSNFHGELDGCKHIIYGLYGKYLIEENYGTINNLNLNNSKQTLVYSNAGIICNCIVDGNIPIAGIARSNTGSILNCINNAQINGDTYFVGGIVSSNKGYVYKCKNYGSISSTNKISHNGSYTFYGAGGIVGGNKDDGNIVDCMNYGMVTSNTAAGGIAANDYYGMEIVRCYNEGSIRGDGYTGGIVGFACDNTVYYCFNAGTIEGTAENFSVGGIIGYALNTTVNYCHNGGNCKGVSYTGGIVGIDASSTVDQVYNIGSVSATKSDSHYGGLFGSTYGDVNCGYTTVTPVYGNVSYNGNTPSEDTVKYVSPSNMKNLSNLTGFSTSIWATNSSINNGYPYLIELKDTY